MPSTVAAPGTISAPGTTPLAGEVHYSLTASESFLTGYQGINGSGASTNISGIASFITASENHPFSLVYSGGYVFGNNAVVNSSSYQNLGISQILQARHWRLGVADEVSFLPSSPVFGISGVPGVGDVGTSPISTGELPTQSILTNYGQRVSNTVSGSVEREISGRMYADGFVSYGTQYFLQDPGFNNRLFSASGGLRYQLGERDNIAGNYIFSRFTYDPGAVTPDAFAFEAQGLTFVYDHNLNRKMSFQVSGGPQWISSDHPALIPNQVVFAASVSLNYVGQRTRAFASYSRGPNTGSGVLVGAVSDDVNLTVQHSFTRNWDGGLTANYGRASGLTNLPGFNGNTDGFYGGVQVSRHIGRDFSAFASYNVVTQNTGTIAAAQNAFDGTGHIVSVGLTYSPRGIRIGRH